MWPRLVPPGVCKTPCVVVLTNGTGENSAPAETVRLELRCNWQDGPRQMMNAQKQLIQLSGVALLNGDIAPELPILTGTVEIYGISWNIYRGSKCRNPDGTVNYTKLELM